MQVRITSDANMDSGVGEIVDKISGPTEHYFLSKEYGTGLFGISVVLMCRDPHLNLRRRLRFAKKEKKLFMDVMFDFEEMRHTSCERRLDIVVKQLVLEIPVNIHRYSIRDFHLERFTDELKRWFETFAIESG